MLVRQGQVLLPWVRSEPEKAEREAARIAAWRAACEELRGTIAPAPGPAPEQVDGDWLAIYPWGDPHIGMLAHAPEAGKHHDLSLAIRDYTTATRLLVASAPRAKHAIFANMGDFFHAQDDRQVTPGHGHKLDVDGRWHKVVKAGIQLQINTVRHMLTKHETVGVINVPGNHDPDAARMLSICLELAFANEPRVTVHDNANPYQVTEFGENLILWAHGDGAKREALPGLLAARWREAWGRTRYHYGYTGHIHHETEKEFPGMRVRSFNILPPKDAWHAFKGYDSEQSIEVIGHHIKYGRRSRCEFGIDLVRDAQLAGVA
jgi:hypothetical protein